MENGCSTSSAALDSWKPMADDFYSPSNLHGLDPDDAEVILTGYSMYAALLSAALPSAALSSAALSIHRVDICSNSNIVRF